MKEKRVIDRGLETWKDFNKVTLAVGLGAIAIGLVLNKPWLASLGLASIVIDAAQIAGIDFLQKRRKKTQSTKMTPGTEYSLA